MDKFREGNEKAEGGAIEKVSLENVKLSKCKILEGSPILAEMENNGEKKIISASYNVSTGKIDLFE